MTARRDDDIVKSTINEHRNVHIRTHVDELIAAVRKGFVTGCFPVLFKKNTHTMSLRGQGSLIKSVRIQTEKD
jgi:hypothetical protein